MLLALALAGACTLVPAVPANVAEPIVVQYGRNFSLNSSAGTASMQDVELRQNPDTLIRAKQTTVRGIEQSFDNSRWDLKDEVHIEFRGAVLDADAATAVFVGGQLASIHVTGGPAHFSHQPKDSQQRNQGRANTIDYDAATSKLRFSGNTWYSFGMLEAQSGTATYTYDLDDGALTGESDGTDQSRTRLTIYPDKRVPAPRTPDRTDAQ